MLVGPWTFETRTTQGLACPPTAPPATQGVRGREPRGHVDGDPGRIGALVLPSHSPRMLFFPWNTLQTDVSDRCTQWRK